MPRRLLASAVLCAAASAAAAEVDGLDLEPPPGFTAMPLAPRETRALAPGPRAAPRALLAVFAHAPSDASLVVTRIDAPLEDGPELRDRLAQATVDHFRDELELDLRLAWATRGKPPGPLLEVAGRFPLDGSEHAVVLAWFGAGARSYVVTLSAPSSNLDALLPGFETTLSTVRIAPDPGPPAVPQRGWLAAAGAALGLLVALALRRRKPTKAAP